MRHHQVMKAVDMPIREYSSEASNGGALRLDFQAQVCEKINFCCLSHPAYDTVVWYLKLTKISLSFNSQ